MITLALAAGCTDSTDGVATPGGQDGPGTEEPGPTGDPAESESSTEPTVEIPPRPEDLSLDGVKPCSLFTKAQLTQLEITDPPTPKTSSGYFEAPGCDLEIATVETFRSYEVLTVTEEGIGPWLSGKRNVEAELSEVAGFPAATYWLRGAEGNQAMDCATAIDVAEGQQLMVTADNDANRSFALDQLCQMAENAAGMAIQTLQTVR
ncbi:DUF3558 domain-containing protein [Actinophytocola sp.]|uniref:DUF3558 domain-containing protein n=1 Tax=Actinophytocola sp. TaxID=1872138 RepID=UPI003D6B7908